MMRVLFDDDQLLKMIGSIRDHPSLERLHLGQYDHTSLNISHVGCEAIATLLSDPTCNLRSLTLHYTNIKNKGVNTLVNGLRNNTKLRELNLHGNRSK